jgi:hypothetical protein
MEISWRNLSPYSSQTSQNRLCELTHLWNIAKTAQQSKPVLLFFLIFKWTTCKLTLSHFGSQYQWSKRKQILMKERAIPEHTDAYYRGPPTFTKKQGLLNCQRLLKRSVQYAVLRSLNPWKCHNTEKWISFLFRVVCLATPITLPTARAYLLLYGLQICNQRKSYNKIT